MIAMAKMKDLMEVKIRITDTDFWEDILDLLKKVCDKDPEVSKKLAEIMSKHDEVYDYSVKR